MKNILIGLVALLVIIGGIYFAVNMSGDGATPYEKVAVPTVEEVPPVVSEATQETPIEEPVKERGPISVIGKSVDGQNINAYHFGKGDKEVLLVGGIHGGYSWNTALLGYELVEWFTANPNLVPADLTVTIIPVLNPDGLKKAAGTAEKFTAAAVTKSDSIKTASRFNANNVDLNRNFACEWKAVGTWQNKEVSGGDASFSEPESQAIRDYVTANKPAAAVTWYSAAGGVYASDCKKGLSTQTKALTDLYAKASGYSAHEEFDYYEITGDMVNWFASQSIPAISVLLTNHTDTELVKNKSGIEAVLSFVAKTE